MKEAQKFAPVHLWVTAISLMMLSAVFTAFFIPDGKMLSSARNRYFLGEGARNVLFSFHPWGAGIAAAGVIALIVFLILEKGSGQAFRFAGACPFFALFCSRLLYGLAELPFYLNYAGFTALFRADEGGMSLAGAMAGAFLAYRLTFGKDRGAQGSLALSLAVLVPLVKGACFFSPGGLGVGRETESGLPGLFSMQGEWGCLLRVYAIEFLLGLLILALLLILKRYGGGEMLFSRYLVMFGVMEVLMLSLRNDHHMEWGFVKAGMIFSFLPAAFVTVFSGTGKKIRLFSAGVTMLFAIFVFLLEKARDRAWIPEEGILYALYLLLCVGYIVYSIWVSGRGLRLRK